jgi:hypothetical protein
LHTHALGRIRADNKRRAALYALPADTNVEAVLTDLNTYKSV